jgi:hypothetical protein
MRRRLISAGAGALAQQLNILAASYAQTSETLLRMRRLLRSCCCACADFRDPAAAHAHTLEILLLCMRRLQKSCCCAYVRDLSAHAQIS